MNERRWLILCMRRRIWWRAARAGYTDHIREAGRYSDDEALSVVESTTGGDSCVQLVPADAAEVSGEIYIARGVMPMKIAIA